MSFRMGLFVRGALAAALMVGPAQAVTLTFTGTTGVASTNALGNGTYNYGPPYAHAGALTTHTIDAAGSNLSGAYTAGDDLLFDGSATGSLFNIAVNSSIPTAGNPSSLKFNDAGGVGKTYIFTRASTTAGSSISLGFTGGTAGATVDSYSSTSPFGATVPSTGATQLLLDTGFTGKVILRTRANNAGAGTTTINGGTLEINDGGALPTNGVNSNNPGTVTLNGGKLIININEGNEETGEGSRNPASAQLNGTLNVTANSTITNGAINFDGTARRQDIWGGSAGPIALSPGVTLNVETGGGATVKGPITGTAGSTATVSLGSSSTYLRFSATTGANANVHYNLGTSTASLDLNASGTFNLGHLSGGSRTAVRGATGAVATAQIGNLGQSGTYSGQVLNGFGSSNGGGPAAVTNAVAHTNISKVGAGTLTLSGENRYSGTTAVSGGTLQAGSTSAFGDSASTVTASTGGTLDLNGQTQEAGKNYVINGGALVNNSSTAVSIHSGASGHANSLASGAIFGAGTDTGTPATTGAWTMNGGTVPTVAITGGGGTGATGEVKMQLGWLRLNAGVGLGTAGSGYTKAPILTFDAPSDPNGRRAQAYVTIGPPGSGTAGTITGIQVVDPGWGYTSVPNLTIDNTGTGGTGFRPIFAMAMNELEITNAGSGYTSAPTIAVTNLGTVSGYTGATPPTPTAPVTTGGFGSVTLNAVSTNAIGGSGNISIPAAVSGAGGFDKTGAGTVTLSGTNPYAGATSVSQGKLLVNGANTGTGSVTVLSSATLGGTGSIAGAVTVNSGGILSPGASIESLDVGSLSLAGTMIVEYDGGGTPAIDLTNVTLSLDVSAGTVDFQQIGSSLTAPQYIFANYGSLVGTFATVLNLPAGYYVDYGTGTNSFISLTAVPEAGAFLAGTVVSLLVGAGVTLRRRRK